MEYDERMLDTLKEFYESIGESKKTKDKLLENINTHEKKGIVLNLVELEYGFNKYPQGRALRY